MIEEVVQKQREFFNTKETFSLNFRKIALIKLKNCILKYEDEIKESLKQDLGKSSTESYMSEIGMVLNELSYAIKNLKKWMKRERVKTPLEQFHSKSFVVKEPLGVVLIMSPWNYPFMLAMDPLIGALGAGNCAVIKPASYAKNTSNIIKKIIEECFEERYVAVVLGGREQNTELLEQRFDYIFFTGSVNVGKIVAEKASKFLTPVTLELGGKSPCIIDETANLKVTARRLAFGKFLNVGQTCVAPDYLLINSKVKEKFVSLLKEEIVKMFGENPIENENYGKIINEKHFNRICRLIDKNKCVFGGALDENKLKIAPTILDNVSLDDAVMKEEIFGPILPIIEFDKIEDAVSIISKFEKPLALYLFSNDKNVQNYFLEKVPFGGGCVNDTIIHLATTQMGFGGVGQSGYGAYHGKRSFLLFSHEKSIVKKYNYVDLPIRYQPYSKFKEKIIKMFLK